MIAVLTADMVYSRKYNKLALEGLYEVIEVLKQEYQLSRIDIIRGDELQMDLEPEKCLEVAVALKAAVNCIEYGSTNADIRISLAIGGYEVLGDSPSKSYGEAHNNSGINLDNLKKTGDSWSFWLQAPELSIEQTMFELLLNEVCVGWTPKQAQFVYKRLQGKSSDQIAQEMGISKSSASNLKKTSRYATVEKMRAIYGNITTKLRSQ